MPVAVGGLLTTLTAFLDVKNGISSITFIHYTNLPILIFPLHHPVTDLNMIPY
jgi:hypothetical protein